MKIVKQVLALVPFRSAQCCVIPLWTLFYQTNLLSAQRLWSAAHVGNPWWHCVRRAVRV